MGSLQTEATSRHLSPLVIVKDHAAIDSAIEFFERRHIFDATIMTPNLMNIASGYVAPDTVNINEAEAVGTWEQNIAQYEWSTRRMFRL